MLRAADRANERGQQRTERRSGGGALCAVCGRPVGWGLLCGAGRPDARVPLIPYGRIHPKRVDGSTPVVPVRTGMLQAGAPTRESLHFYKLDCGLPRRLAKSGSRQDGRCTGRKRAGQGLCSLLDRSDETRHPTIGVHSSTHSAWWGRTAQHSRCGGLGRFIWRFIRL